MIRVFFKPYRHVSDPPTAHQDMFSAPMKPHMFIHVLNRSYALSPYRVKVCSGANKTHEVRPQGINPLFYQSESKSQAYSQRIQAVTMVSLYKFHKHCTCTSQFIICTNVFYSAKMYKQNTNVYVTLVGKARNDSR